MLRCVSGKLSVIVFAVSFCLSAGVLMAKAPAAPKSNELYAKLAVEKLNALWQQYATAESTSGKKPSLPKTFSAACKLMLEAKLIDAIPSARGIDGWQITFAKGDTQFKCNFGYQKREEKADDVSETIAESACKTTSASLNAAWLQYAATEMAADRTPQCPDDYESACKILINAKFIEETPNPKQYPKWEVIYIKGGTAQECKFEVAKAAKKPTKKYARKKSDKTLLVQSREGYCSNLNSAWQKYVAAEKAKSRKLPTVPADYKAACERLVSGEYIKSAPLEEVDGYKIEFVKGDTAAACEFKVVEPAGDNSK